MPTPFSISAEAPEVRSQITSEIITIAMRVYRARQIPSLLRFLLVRSVIYFSSSRPL